MRITHHFLDGLTAEILRCDSSSRLGTAWLPWQTESSLRPVHQLLTQAIEKDLDLPWSQVEALLVKIPSDKRLKYKAAIEVIENRKSTWDLLQNRVSGFGKFGAPDFQQRVTIPGRGDSLLVRGEGLAPGTMQEIINHLMILGPLVHQLAQNKTLGPRRNWFAQESLGEVETSLDNFDKYLNTRCESLTFKRVHVGSRCGGDVVAPGLAGQVSIVLLEGQNDPDFRKPGAFRQVHTGLRIYIGPLYYNVSNAYDEILTTPGIYRFMTLAHELSHKILSTLDNVYDLPDCRAIKDTATAVGCADSWGYFLTEYWKTPAFTLRQAAQGRRAAMGYDD